MHLEENRCISMIFWHNWTSNIHVSTGECGINQINKFNFQEFSIAKGYVIIVYFGVYLIKSKSNKYLCSIKGRYYLWNSLLTSEQCLHQFCLTCKCPWNFFGILQKIAKPLLLWQIKCLIKCINTQYYQISIGLNKSSIRIFLRN